jgi:hypothetical protein
LENNFGPTCGLESFMNLAIRVTRFSTNVSFMGTIHDFTPGEVSLLLAEFVPVGTSAAVTFKEATFEGEILYCEPKDGQYQTNVRFQDSAESGLRRTPRFTVKLSGEVFARNSGDPVPAIITDISGNGLGVDVSLSLAAGEPIVVSSEMNIAFGVVRYCRERSEDVFHVGVELHHVVERTPDLKEARGTLRRFS